MKRGPRKALDVARFIVALVFLLLFLVVLALGSVAEAQTRDEIEEIVRVTADRHGIDPDLALAIAEVESGLNPAAVGGLGELGVFQLRPEFHRVVPGDVARNAETALRYLVWLRSQCADYGDAFFVCFNTGPYRRLKHPRRFSYYVKVETAKAARKAKGNADAIAQRD